MPLDPTLAEVLRLHSDARALDLHTCLPGIVNSYDAAKQVAEVLPVIRRAVPDGDGGTELEDIPPLPNVPVRWERAGGYYVHFPLAKGDHGWLIFSEAAIALWRTTGQVSEPGDQTRHGLSYPFFLPGAWPDADPLPDAPADGEAVIIVPAGGVVRVSEAGQAAQLVALADLVKARLDALQNAHDTHTHVLALSAGTGTAATTAAPVGPLGPVAAKTLKAQAP